MSGALFNGDKPGSYLKFVKSRLIGLLVPFVVAMVVLQLPKHYFS